MNSHSTSGTKKGALLRFLLTSSMMAWAGPAVLDAKAHAQDASSDFETVIVTAQKREESLQTVPLSVQAITSEKLDELNIQSFTDYAAYLPNVSFSATYGPGFNRAFIRGIASGENGNHSGSQPSVGTYLDEQPITTITGPLDLHVYDVARVEVLSGPQGTLYGASSQAGTIRIITNKPDTSGASGGFDSEVNTVDGGASGGVLEGFVNIPLASNVAVRIVGWTEHDAGYIDNVLSSRTYATSGITATNTGFVHSNYNTTDTIGMRAALRIELNDNWTVTPSIMGQNERTGGVFGFDPSIGDLQVSHGLPEDFKDRWTQSALTIEGKVANLDVVYAGAFLERGTDGRQDYSDYGYFYDSLFGSGAYFYDNNNDLIDPAQWVFDQHDYTKVTHELRFTTPAENRLRLLGGLYYQRQTDEIYQRYIVFNLNDALEIPTLPDTVWLTSQERVDIDKAIFGEVSFDFTDKLTGTAGVRFFDSSTSLFGFFGYGAGFASSQGEAICFASSSQRDAPCTDVDKHVSESGETYRANLEYHLTPDQMIYATYSTGYRPGGVNRRPNLGSYDSDFLYNYEAGWKTTMGPLRWNGAVYLERWKDFQYAFISSNSNGLTQIQNAGNADVYGVETDVTWLATDHLTINGALSALHGETTKDTDFAPKGTQLPTAPELKANLTARYEFAIGDWNSYWQASALYQGSSTLDLRPLESDILGTLDAFTQVNLSIGGEHDGIRVSAYLDNAFDERGIVSRYTECAPGTCGGKQYDIPIRPRTFGIMFGRDF